MRRSSIACLLSAVTLAVWGAGCSEPTFSVPTVPVGVLSVFSRSQSGAYIARPQGLFALAESAPSADSRSTADTCQLGPYVPQSTIPSVEQINAGDSILFDVAGSASTVLRPINEFGIIVYATVPREIGFTPGAEVRFTVPGVPGGFPESEITSLTPSAITSLSPIPSRPSLEQPLTVSWEPAGDDSSRFEVLLIYAAQGANAYNQQLVCDWRDDGAGTIRSELLGGWSLSEDQRIEVTRYRTQRQELGGAFLMLLTTFDTLPPLAP